MQIYLHCRGVNRICAEGKTYAEAESNEIYLHSRGVNRICAEGKTYAEAESNEICIGLFRPEDP